MTDPNTAPDRPDQTENDRALGYSACLNSGYYDVDWLASEVRMLHVQRENSDRWRRESEQRYAVREVNQRHFIAHEIAERMFAWKLGKHATAGAVRALDAVYPISRCDKGCDGRVSR